MGNRDVLVLFCAEILFQLILLELNGDTYIALCRLVLDGLASVDIAIFIGGMSHEGDIVQQGIVLVVEILRICGSCGIGSFSRQLVRIVIQCLHIGSIVVVTGILGDGGNHELCIIRDGIGVLQDGCHLDAVILIGIETLSAAVVLEIDRGVLIEVGEVIRSLVPDRVGILCPFAVFIASGNLGSLDCSDLGLLQADLNKGVLKGVLDDLLSALILCDLDRLLQGLILSCFQLQNVLFIKPVPIQGKVLVVISDGIAELIDIGDVQRDCLLRLVLQGDVSIFLDVDGLSICNIGPGEAVVFIPCAVHLLLLEGGDHSVINLCIDIDIAVNRERCPLGIVQRKGVIKVRKLFLCVAGNGLPILIHCGGSDLHCLFLVHLLIDKGDGIASCDILRRDLLKGLAVQARFLELVTMVLGLLELLHILCIGLEGVCRALCFAALKGNTYPGKGLDGLSVCIPDHELYGSCDSKRSLFHMVDKGQGAVLRQILGGDLCGLLSVQLCIGIDILVGAVLILLRELVRIGLDLCQSDDIILPVESQLLFPEVCDLFVILCVIDGHHMDSPADLLCSFLFVDVLDGLAVIL